GGNGTQTDLADLVHPKSPRARPQHAVVVGSEEDEAIRCVYHGWKFDRCGQCVEQPAEEAEFARKVTLKTYPTREYLDLVFAYFGDGELPPFPHFPHRTTPGLIQVWNVEQVPCNYLHSFENSMDEVHVAFTHQPGGSHDKLSADLPIITAEETNWGHAALRHAQNRQSAPDAALCAERNPRDRTTARRHGRGRRLVRNLFQFHADR